MEDFWKSMQDLRENARKQGEAQRLMADPGVTPEAGKFYTVSNDFVCGDRSYSGRLIEVIAVNENSVVCQIRGRDVCSWNKGRQIISIGERFWYECSPEFVAAALEGEGTE